MVLQWNVAPSAALHLVPVCACLTDTSHTSYHCSLWVDRCSQWLMLVGNSVVLHMCCSAACPRVTFLCVCAYFCVQKKKPNVRCWTKSLNKEPAISVPPLPVFFCCLCYCCFIVRDVVLPVCSASKAPPPAFSPFHHLHRLCQVDLG